MRGLVLILVSLFVLSGCSDNSKRVLFDGKFYPAKAKRAKGDRESFVGNVRKVQQILAIFDNEKADVQPLHANLRGLTISRNDVVMVNLRTEPPIFTAAGKSRYSEEARKQTGAAH